MLRGFDTPLVFCFCDVVELSLLSTDTSTSVGVFVSCDTPSRPGDRVSGTSSIAADCEALERGRRMASLGNFTTKEQCLHFKLPARPCWIKSHEPPVDDFEQVSGRFNPAASAISGEFFKLPSNGSVVAISDLSFGVETSLFFLLTLADGVPFEVQSESSLSFK